MLKALALAALLLLPGVAHAVPVPEGIANAQGPAYTASFMSGAMPSGLTFTRSSSAMYYNAAGVLTSAASNAPRFDYNPVTLRLNGLLIEEQRTNILTYSGALTTSPWTSSGNMTATANAIAAPDGTLTATKLVPTAANVTQYYNNLTTTKGSSYAMTAYLKAGTYRYEGITFAAGGGFGNGFFILADLVGGTIVNSGVAGAGVLNSSSIQNVGNGWYRVSMVGTDSNDSAIYPTFFVGTSSSATPTATGTPDGASYVYAWGAQIEQATFSTSYIPTTSASVTRAADGVSTTALTWYNQTAGTAVLQEILGPYIQAYQNYFQFRNTSNNAVVVSQGTGGGGATGQVYTQVGSNSANSSNVTAGQMVRLGIAYVTGGNHYAQNGALYDNTNFTAGSPPTGINLLTIASNTTNVAQSNAWLQNFTYYNYARTAAQLQGDTQ